MLTEKDVKHIKYLIEKNTDKKKILNYFKISRSNLNNIISGKNWKNIPADTLNFDI